MNKKSLGYLCSAMFLGLVITAGPTQAQDDSDSVDCFFASNQAEAACQIIKPAQVAAKKTVSKKTSLPEYSETVAESVDCFYSEENGGEAACSAKKATSASASRTSEHVVLRSSVHGG